MKSRIKVLVVDDEPKIVEVVRSYLEHAGYEVFAADSGIKALKLFREMHPDFIILDWMLPDISGDEVLTNIRLESRVPVIMLTAKVEEENVLKGLDTGADDYITKPFSPKQLLARVRVILRRTSDEPLALSNTLSYRGGDLTVDSIKHEVRKQGQIVNLTPNEYRILLTLVKYPQKAFTREELISNALGDDFEGFDRTIDAHVKNVRQKIETNPKSPVYVITVYGIGYRFGGA